MRLSARIEKELDRLAASSPGSGELRLQVEGGELWACVAAVDNLACALKDFRYSNTSPGESSVEELRQRATKLAEKLSYLLEAISPVEIDNEACAVQMRSNPPEQDDDSSKYYELVVSRNETRLTRYLKSAGQPRQVEPATVTREVLVRLVTDITAPNG